eukprot:XP_011680298.1 PREDICTED: 60S acidic ribosomal protein P0-like [Strongylocentrotus purpuratus]
MTSFVKRVRACGSSKGKAPTKQFLTFVLTSSCLVCHLLLVYEAGSVFHPSILDITDEDIHVKFIEGVANVAALCLQIGYPTPASVPHSIVNGFKNILAIAVATEITFAQAEQAKAFLADPSAFLAAAAASAPVAEKKEEVAAKKEESEEESDDDMGFGLFD